MRPAIYLEEKVGAVLGRSDNVLKVVQCKASRGWQAAATCKERHQWVATPVGDVASR